VSTEVSNAAMVNHQGNKKRTELPEQTVILQNIQDPAHPAKNQHSRALLFHEDEKFVQDDHPAGVLDEVLICCVRWTRFLRNRVMVRCIMKNNVTEHTAPSKRYG
jgi:hypothetical protein